MLSVDQLSKNYGAHAALQDVSFALAPGQFCVLLGPNGAGKSTLFQLLTGVFVPNAGRITVAGFDLQRQTTQALARIGVVFQQQSLDLDLSAEHNLRFHADLHGMSRSLSRQRIAEAAEAMHMSADMGRPVRLLSGGTRRKVELMRALLHRPGLLLMDEATVGLDPKSRQDLLATVRQQVAERGLTVLWATHWVQEADAADRLLVLHRGKLLAQGDRAEVEAALGGESLEQGFIARTGPVEKS